MPIRTWVDRNEDRPGFSEMDLVDHSGGVTIRGADHAWTLCFTDVHTCPVLAALLVRRIWGQDQTLLRVTWAISSSTRSARPVAAMNNQLVDRLSE